jgi:superfamily II DNA/RNA helicase
MSIDSADRFTLPATDTATEIETVTEAPVTEAPVEADTDTDTVHADADADADIETADAEDDAETGPTFGDLGLADGIVRKLAQNGVTVPFPIQAATIPDALAGRDILGRGRTGSGKTLSFGLPLLTLLAEGRTEAKRPRGIVLTPTRELAMQVADALQPYGDVLGLRMKVVCGGTSMGNQIYALERGVDILVATPGRLRDLIERGACALDQVRIAVLDEADQMADMGFLPEVTELLDLVPPGGQRLLFSATLEHEVDTLVKRYLKEPVTHEVDPSAGAVTTMTHHVLVVKPRDKAPVTNAIAARKGRTIVFVRTQMGADRVAEQLRDAGVKADALHGGMTQGARTRTLADFKDGYVNVLVATDVAARGIHVDGIDLVLNVDPAGDHKDYLHRSGRTARAGQSGTVVSLALPHQRRSIFRLMEDAGVEASRHIVGGAGAFDEDVARITGARSLTEVQADAAGNAAQQAEREAAELARELERAQRRAVELREEADRLAARAARERGEVPAAAETVEGSAAASAEGTAAQDAPAEAAAPAAEAPYAPEAAPAAEAAPVVPAQVSREERYGRDERPRFNRDDRPFNRDDRPRFNRDDRRDERPRFNRDDRPGFNRDDRRDERPRFNRDDRRGGGDRPFNRDDRPRFNRDDRRDERPRFNRDDRPGFNRDDRRDERPRFSRDDRPGFNRDDRRDERPRFNRDDRRDDRPRFNRDDRHERPRFSRDDRPAFNRDRDERPRFDRDHRSGGGDRPFNRDRRDERPSFGHHRDRDNDRRPYGRRDDRPSTDRRADKPRWKRNG